MNATCKMFRFLLKQISHEMMMILLIIAPFFIGFLFKLGIPLLETKLLHRFGYGDVLIPYYDLFGWLFAMVTGMMFAFVGGLIVLGEIDDGIAKYMMVTPPGEIGYLLSRIVIPGMLSGLVTICLLPVFSLTRLSLLSILVMTLSTVLCGIITALLVVTISANKVEGMAVGKLSGLFGITVFVPILIKTPIKYVFTLFPMYHVGLWFQTHATGYLFVAVALFILWMTILYRLFRKKFA